MIITGQLVFSWWLGVKRRQTITWSNDNLLYWYIYIYMYHSASFSLRWCIQQYEHYISQSISLYLPLSLPPPFFLSFYTTYPIQQGAGHASIEENYRKWTTIWLFGQNSSNLQKIDYLDAERQFLPPLCHSVSGYYRNLYHIVGSFHSSNFSSYFPGNLLVDALFRCLTNPISVMMASMIAYMHQPCLSYFHRDIIFVIAGKWYHLRHPIRNVYCLKSKIVPKLYGEGG